MLDCSTLFCFTFTRLFCFYCLTDLLFIFDNAILKGEFTIDFYEAV